MVFVKVRETYDLHTTQNKMTVIGIHTPKPDIIKKNYPGLLMQCKAYRPVSADVRLACASVLPLDPLGVGLSEGSVAPEDVFNPILYKAMSNKGMSQLEARINYLDRVGATGLDVDGNTAHAEVDNFTNQADEFAIYYGLLSNTSDWKHANPQSGLSMTKLKPLVYEMVYNIGDNGYTPYLVQDISDSDWMARAPEANGNGVAIPVRGVLGKAKEFPFLNCTSYTTYVDNEKDPERASTGYLQSGMNSSHPYNAETGVPYLPVVCGCIIVPPSRRHELFYRMVVEWTIEFSKIRPLSEITEWIGLADIGNETHYQNYSYSKVKEAVTGDPSSILDQDSCMVSANVDIEKVM